MLVKGAMGVNDISYSYNRDNDYVSRTGSTYENDEMAKQSTFTSSLHVFSFFAQNEIKEEKNPEVSKYKDKYLFIRAV